MQSTGCKKFLSFLFYSSTHFPYGVKLNTVSIDGNLTIIEFFDRPYIRRDESADLLEERLFPDPYVLTDEYITSNLFRNSPA